MIGCSSGQYFDYTVASKPAYIKSATTEKVITVAQAETPATSAPVSTVASLPLEASVVTPVASRTVARTAPLTTSAVAAATASAPVDMNKTVEAASSNKKFMKVASKIKRDAKSGKKANAVNGYIKIGLILILAGVLIGILPHLGLLGSIVAIVGVVFLVLGLLEMI
ncbi:hypothetical protein TH61_11560 [Rufibacter sp. DG15C]|nr:hypothetical protein TH61_11560 [Rufibacter sp. DG15C]